MMIGRSEIQEWGISQSCMKINDIVLFQLIKSLRIVVGLNIFKWTKVNFMKFYTLFEDQSYQFLEYLDIICLCKKIRKDWWK